LCVLFGFTNVTEIFIGADIFSFFFHPSSTITIHTGKSGILLQTLTTSDAYEAMKITSEHMGG
jgi:hypothetical protein